MALEKLSLGKVSVKNLIRAFYFLLLALLSITKVNLCPAFQS